MLDRYIVERGVSFTGRQIWNVVDTTKSVDAADRIALSDPDAARAARLCAVHNQAYRCFLGATADWPRVSQRRVA